MEPLRLRRVIYEPQFHGMRLVSFETGKFYYIW